MISHLGKAAHVTNTSINADSELEKNQITHAQ